MRDGADYVTSPCAVERTEVPGPLFAGGYPCREGLPHTWLRMVLAEGKCHQIRKMTRAVGHPCQRLVRVAEFFAKLRIDSYEETVQE